MTNEKWRVALQAEKLYPTTKWIHWGVNIIGRSGIAMTRKVLGRFAPHRLILEKPAIDIEVVDDKTMDEETWLMLQALAKDAGAFNVDPHLALALSHFLLSRCGNPEPGRILELAVASEGLSPEENEVAAIVVAWRVMAEVYTLLAAAPPPACSTPAQVALWAAVRQEIENGITDMATLLKNWQIQAAGLRPRDGHDELSNADDGEVS